MTVWSVPWIENLAQYDTLTSEVDQIQALLAPITVHMFHEPTQAEWEDAYTRQTLLTTPIQPGARLFWYDMRNATLKRYATIWKADGVTVDPVVRRVVAETNSRGSWRLLGTRQPIAGHFFHPVTTPNPLPSLGIFFDLNMMAAKKLIALMFHFRVTSPGLLALQQMRNVSSIPVVLTTSSGLGWGSGFDLAGGGWLNFNATLERYAATVTLTDFSPGGTNSWETMGFPSGAAAPQLDINVGFALVLGPAPEVSAGTQIGAYDPVGAITLMGSRISGGTPVFRMYESYGLKADGGSGLYEAGLGSNIDRTGITLGTNEKAYVYGLFQGDPGEIEVFA